MNLPIYSFDTSALIDGLDRHYPQTNFPTVWENIDSLIEGGRLFVSEEVYRELERKNTESTIWCKARQRVICSTDPEIVDLTKEILAAFPKFVKESSTKNRADPFVIAVARLKNAIVVTGELPSNTDRVVKIPNECDHFKIEWMNLSKLIANERWTY